MQESVEIVKVKERIAELESQLADLEARLPAHSIPPNLIAAIDQLDEELKTEKKQLSQLLDKSNNP